MFVISGPDLAGGRSVALVPTSSLNLALYHLIMTSARFSVMQPSAVIVTTQSVHADATHCDACEIYNFAVKDHVNFIVARINQYLDLAKFSHRTFCASASTGNRESDNYNGKYSINTCTQSPTNQTLNLQFLNPKPNHTTRLHAMR